DSSRNNALLADGTVWNWGTGTSTTPVQIPGLTDIKSIAGELALHNDGTMLGWGDNSYGQLGDGTTTNRVTPVQVTGISGAIAIVSGRHSLALMSDHTVMAWGNNMDGQLGDGTTTTRKTPVPVSGLSGVIAIAAGNNWSLALKADGTVWAWGFNCDYYYYGSKLGDGTSVGYRTTPVQVSGLTGVIAITACGYYSLALKGDGTIWRWGGVWGKFVPELLTTIPGAMTISAGYRHFLALKGDGTVWGWGDNSYGQLGDGIKSFFPKQLSSISLGEDTTPPVVTASPAEGAYIPPLSASLASNDISTIYYTLDGSTPTTGSPVYSGPIPITTTTTLSFMARDRAGNTSSPQTRTYTILPTQTLNFTIQGSGSGIVNLSSGKSCSGSCSRLLQADTTVTLSAVSASASFFSGWSGACSGTGSCTLTMDATKEVTATFDSVCSLPGSPQVISPGSTQQDSPAANALGEVVWSQYDPASGYSQIFSSSRGQLTSDSTNHTAPSINKYGDVVWSQNDGIYGIIDGRAIRLIYDTNSYSPVISDNGEIAYVSGWSRIVSTVRGVLYTGSYPGGLGMNNLGDLVWIENGGQIYSLPHG